jgi:uncharacterized membrane protein YfcA
MIPGIEINLLQMIFLSFSVGIVSGFAGVGGGFLMTPALIILGFPAQFAVGTSLTWVMANSIVATLRHKRHGNVDVKLGLIMAAASICGVEIGVRVLTWVKSMGIVDEAVLLVSIFVLVIIGGYILRDCFKSIVNKIDQELHNSNNPNTFSSKLKNIKVRPLIYFPKSKITISLWIILGIGFSVGILSGFMGVGGGFIMVPSLIYLIGLPPFMAVGTDLFQIIFSAGYGSIRHMMNGNVIIYAAIIMLLSSAIGVQLGVIGTRYLKGISMKFILALTILVSIIGSILKLIGIFTNENVSWIKSAEISTIFGGLGLVLLIILSLLIMAIRNKHGIATPSWIKSIIT